MKLPQPSQCDDRCREAGSEAQYRPRALRRPSREREMSIPVPGHSLSLANRTPSIACITLQNPYADGSRLRFRELDRFRRRRATLTPRRRSLAELRPRVIFWKQRFAREHAIRQAAGLTYAKTNTSSTTRSQRSTGFAFVAQQDAMIQRVRRDDLRFSGGLVAQSSQVRVPPPRPEALERKQRTAKRGSSFTGSRVARSTFDDTRIPSLSQFQGHRRTLARECGRRARPAAAEFRTSSPPTMSASATSTSARSSQTCAA